MSSTPLPRPGRAFGFILLFVLGIGGVFWARLPTKIPDTSAPKDLSKSKLHLDAQPVDSSEGSTKLSLSKSEKTTAPEDLPAPDPNQLVRFQSFLAKIKGGSMSREDVESALAELKQQIHDLPPDIAASTLIALLESGDNAVTGLDFVVSNEGVLGEAPTFRVALLDLLGQTEPYAAIDYSQKILNATDQSDEYALALRNLAWLNHEDSLTKEITTRFAALLNRESWLTNPSAGFLEAFDISVAVGGPAMVTELASVLRLTAADGSVIPSGVNRAAFIALDRITLREPDLIANIVSADPAFLDFAPNHRASLISRLDPTTPVQAEALRAYLLSPTADATELSYFAKVFPNANFFEGDRLVTSWETIAPRITSAQRDANALVFVNTLLTDPAFANLTPVLHTVRKRLQPSAPPSAP